MEFNLKDFKFYTYMTESFSQMVMKLDRLDINKLKMMIQGLMDGYKEAKLKYGGPSVAHHFHERIDDHVSNMIERGKKEGQTTSCGKGCGFCCFQKVDITSDEALLLNEFIEEENIELDEEVMTKQTACKDAKEYMELSAKDRKCIFLDNDMSCKVYQYRPGSCRTVLVISDPKDCDTEENRKGQIVRLNALPAEATLITTHMAAEETGGMTEMLIKYKNKDD